MSYEYHVIPGGDATVVTLHGTGADMHDLDSLAQELVPGARVVGLQGDVDEDGLLRWFKRHRPGEFDLDDLRSRVDALADWLPRLAKKEGFSLGDAVFVGFSNGANMIAALLQKHPSVVRRAALLHGQVPLPEQGFGDLSGHRVFVSAGRADRLIPFAQSAALRDELVAAGAQVEFFEHPAGHQVTPGEVSSARRFLA